MVTLAPGRRGVRTLPTPKPEPVPPDGFQACDFPACVLRARWTFKYHTGNDGECDKKHFCREHTDETIQYLNRAFRGGSGVTCPVCDNWFYRANDYVLIERIP